MLEEPRVERLRIAELLARKSKRCRREVSRKELAEALFPSTDLGRPLHGESRPLSIGRKQSLVSEWDRGKQLTALKLRHIARMAEFFKTKSVHDLIEFVEPNPTQ